MTIQFQFTSHGRTLFLEHLKTLISHTESDPSGRSAYQFSNAEIGQSGYTIGIHQFDLRSPGNLPQARERLAELGFTNDEIAKLIAAPSADNPVSDWNERLNTEANRQRIDGYAEQDLMG